MTSSSTAPLPQPEGKYVVSPKVYGQSSVVRQELSQGSTGVAGLNIVQADGTNIDPDTITATVFQKTDFTDMTDPYGVGLTKTISDLNHPSVGIFSVLIDPSFTANLGTITVQWEYVVDGQPYEYWDFYQVLGYMPTYQSLNDGEKGVVRIVSWMFEDLYDSVEGGPHLKEEFQTHFGTETIARSMELAMSRINITSQPYTNYNVGLGVGPRFPDAHYSLLVMGTYREVVRHLIRSYVEMPVLAGSAGVASVDRTSYMERWDKILTEDADDYRMAMRSFKRSLLNLGGGSLLVAGGQYANPSSYRSGMYASQIRGSHFMFPASTVQVRPSGG